MNVEMRRLSGEDAASLWRQLIEGAWSVVERYDEAGRTVFLALHTGAHPARPWHRLSERERAIIADVAAGKSNREIAESFGISASTVAGHLRAARRKLEGVRRIDLVREWRAAIPSK